MMGIITVVLILPTWAFGEKNTETLYSIVPPWLKKSWLLCASC